MKPLIALAALSLLLSPLNCFGGLVTYNVDLSSTNPTSFHVLRVFGTITVDADLAFDAAVQSSDLQIQHDGGTLVSLGSVPSVETGSPNLNLNWLVVGNSLYVERIGTGDSAMVFQSSFGFQSGLFRLGSGNFDHNLFFDDFPHQETATLKASSGVDSGNGFFIGIVPEPSSFLMVSLGMTCLAGRRRTR